MNRHKEKAAKEAARNLPVGFISQDVKRERKVTPTTPPATHEVVKPVKDAIPIGFIAEDVKKRHTH